MHEQMTLVTICIRCFKQCKAGGHQRFAGVRTFGMVNDDDAAKGFALCSA